jgi:hypothetical protein
VLLLSPVVFDHHHAKPRPEKKNINTYFLAAIWAAVARFGASAGFTDAMPESRPVSFLPWNSAARFDIQRTEARCALGH